MKRRLLALWRWLTDSARYLGERPQRLATVLVAVGVGGVAGWIPGAAGFEYVWRDPHMCNDCHVHDYADEAYFRSVHAGLTTCHDCHVVPIMHYPRNLVLTPLATGERLEHRPHVDSVLCSACHLEGYEAELTGPMTPEVLERVVKVDRSPLHMLHLESAVREPGPARGGAKGADAPAPHHDTAHHDDGAAGAGHHGGETRTITCMDCHGSENNRAHRFMAARENCLACHEGISESTGRLAELQCQECHFEGFLGSTTDAVEAAAVPSPPDPAG